MIQVETTLEILKKVVGQEEILTEGGIAFLIALHEKFNGRRLALLDERVNVAKKISAGEMPKFLDETKEIRESDWTVAELPIDLLDRRVEITGPVERKMMINALNSGAKVFMADIEDSNSPTWENIINGQINLKDVANKTIEYVHPVKNTTYRLNTETAVLMVRPRGWHLNEKHILIEGKEMSASLVDFGLHFFHNAKTLIENGSGPYFYLPKLESYQEARLWNDVFVFAQNYIGIPQKSIKATVLIETILASFQMDEILYELRDHSAGLNCGRWDYIFSFIKKFKDLEGYVLPDRAQVTMKSHCMRSYSQLVIKTCHKRGVHAMGGMAAQIPIKNNEEANMMALNKVRLDKEQEAKEGHDGTWVAHPGLIPIAMDIFNTHMSTPNQIHVKRNDLQITEADLLKAPEGTITLKGLKTNIDVGIQYTEAWLRGQGCVPIYNLMEDAATAEISRTQVWQWIHSKAKTSNGKEITLALVIDLLPEIQKKIKNSVGEETYTNGKFTQATDLFLQQLASETLDEFLTLSAYAQL